MDTLSLKEQLLDRITKLVVLGTRTKQIAQACGLSEERVSEICESEAFRARLAEMQTESLEQLETLNSGWDAVEENALGHVLEAMQANPDPEFALRVAAQANKAQRRGGSGNAPIQGRSQAAAVIQLNLNFISKLQENNLFGQEAIAAEAKRVDVLPIAQAQHLLRDEMQFDIENLFRVETQ